MLFIWLGVAFALDINPWFLPNEELRKDLTRLYLLEHYTGTVSDDRDKAVHMAPKIIVLHWTAGSTASSAWNTFQSAKLSGRRDITQAGTLNVSAHFLVEQDGTVHQLLNEKRIARHCIGLNHLSIGIENVGDGKKYPMTDAQIKANVELIRYLAERHEITHVIGHYEYQSFEGHPYFSEKNAQYRSIKVDPGKTFMRLVREQIGDLNLKGPPE